ncbi:MAG: hypothetical protein IK121_11290, partial [Lachnospiraceae bacterium]|nr:hypothetical protein [Lachnospiraceae bacterium]
TGIALRTADDESAGRVDEDFCILVNQFSRNRRLDDKLDQVVYFPEFDESLYEKTIDEHVDGDIPYTYVTYTKK